QNDLDARADRAARANLEGRPAVEGLKERQRNADNQRNDRRENDRRGYDQRGYDQRDYGRRNDNQRGYNQRGYDHRGYEQRGYDHRGWGAGPEHNFYRGGRLPDYYRGHEYVVDDWR